MSFFKKPPPERPGEEVPGLGLPLWKQDNARAKPHGCSHAGSMVPLCVCLADHTWNQVRSYSVLQHHTFPLHPLHHLDILL